MSIAEQMLILKNDFDDVFKAGQKTGGDYETAYNNGYNKGYTDGESVGYENGFADGQGNVTNPFEYAVELNTTYKNATFPNGYELTLVLPCATTLQSSFQNAIGIKKLTLKGNTAKNAIVFTYAFRSESLEILDLSEYNAIVSNGTYTFNGAIALREIKGELDFSQCTNVNQMFNKCNALEEVRFKANSLALSIGFAQSSKLSATSIQSIIDGLATVETAQTLTLSSAIVLSNAQKTSIEGKGWTLVQ